LDGFLGKKHCDAASDYAQEISTRVTAYILGIPAQAGNLFRKWIHDFFEVGITDQETLRKTYGEVRSFFEEEIRRRRAAPGEDLVSHLIKEQINGQPLSDDHISATLRLLLFAGIDTTWCHWLLPIAPRYSRSG
jgi:cytochrome P450